MQVLYWTWFSIEILLLQRLWTSPFKRLVTGRVIKLTIIKVTVTARASVVLEERRILPLHSVMFSLPEDAVEFILF